MSATVLHYTHPDLIDPRLHDLCYGNLCEVSPYPVVSVSRIVQGEALSVLSMFKTLSEGLDMVDAKYVFLAEHDVMYPARHFDQLPASQHGQYNTAVWTMDSTCAWPAPRRILAGYSGIADILRAEVERRITGIEAGKRFKWSEVFRDYADTRRTAQPLLDIRHGVNLTGSRKPGRACAQYPAGWKTEITELIREII